MMCREWYQHPNGALLAYEWDFADVNSPVHAWAALEVFAIDGGRDIDFLSGVFDKLLVNFTWWVNRQDASDKNVFQGGSSAWTTSARSTVRTCLPVTPWSSPTRRAGWAPTSAGSAAGSSACRCNPEAP